MRGRDKGAFKVAETKFLNFPSIKKEPFNLHQKSLTTLIASPSHEVEGTTAKFCHK